MKLNDQLLFQIKKYNLDHEKIFLLEKINIYICIWEKKVYNKIYLIVIINNLEKKENIYTVCKISNYWKRYIYKNILFL